MLGNLNGPTLVVILIIVLLLFGAPKLPGLAKSLGQSMRILKKEVRSDDEGSAGQSNDAADTTSPAAPRSDADGNERRDPGSGAAPGDRP
ncbi:twin-arginine translocase TatA/TatE family subunit [Leucobacter tenebrionis]|uniref:twin-arginine translocase TatA/TatE family subunit n=1 Tax=Leucobacter tenebrionis TaxID=2873270 RepID=UPI001CA66F26|nr:twin-arginine translocase TatA/TatE family subunit [Leucobacter tenebrionis]QZY53013.1 twin-arginine translocase TatA/TatE family subunit [Leucobacter tenebrionis]